MDIVSDDLVVSAPSYLIRKKRVEGSGSVMWFRPVFREDVEQWVAENKINANVYLRGLDSVIVFDNARDQLLFKMRWM